MSKFLTGEGDLIANWGELALYASVLSPTWGVLVLPRASDCIIVVASGGLWSSGFEAPSPFLVASELRELVFQLERPT